MKRLLLVIALIVCIILWPFVRDAYKFSEIASELQKAGDIQSAKHRLRQLLSGHGIASYAFIDRDGKSFVAASDAFEHTDPMVTIRVTIRYTGQCIDIVHVDREMVHRVLGR